MTPRRKKIEEISSKRTNDPLESMIETEEGKAGSGSPLKTEAGSNAHTKSSRRRVYRYCPVDQEQPVESHRGEPVAR